MVLGPRFELVGTAWKRTKNHVWVHPYRLIWFGKATLGGRAYKHQKTYALLSISILPELVLPVNNYFSA
jgi:hypothetical protein